MPLIKINTKVSHGRLQLIFTHQGERHYFSPGFPDTIEGREYVKLIAARIQDDILKDRFTDLEAYRKTKKGAAANPEPPSPAITLAKLWPAYLDYLRPQRSPSTMGTQFKWQTQILDKCPHDLDQAPKIRDWALENYTPDSTKRLFMSLNACCRWAVSCELMESNPFKNIKIELPKKQRAQINPFTAEERDRIIQIIGSNAKWDYYQPIVSFLFFTGCRISEAIALEWSHIASDEQSLTFEQAAVSDELGRLRIKPGLKRQQKRKIPLSDRVRECLGYRREGLVFPAPRTNGVMDLSSNFAQRNWKPVLQAAGIEHRNLYHCRHTFITLALKGRDGRSGLSVQDVAKLVGNSPEIIYRCYAGTTADLALPDW
jgi:integrase